MSVETHGQERWGTRIGLVLAMAGNAVGLGNFLRFPVQAAQNGGGTFMIPYFISFLLLGIPLMWVEWGIGRYGGRHGHGTVPGMFDMLTGRKKPWAKYSASSASSCPWWCSSTTPTWSPGCSRFSCFSLTGDYFGLDNVDEMRAYLASYQTIGESSTTTAGLPSSSSSSHVCSSPGCWRRGLGRHREAGPLRHAGVVRLRLHPDDPGLTLPAAEASPPRAELHLEPGLGSTRQLERLAGCGRPDVLHPFGGHGDYPDLRLLSQEEGRRHPDRPLHCVDQRVRRGRARRNHRHSGGSGLLRCRGRHGDRPGRRLSTWASSPWEWSSRACLGPRSGAAWLASSGSSCCSSPA